MAIIRSVAIGKARKSIGNVTMRTVRGRTIASEKVGERPITRGPSGAQLEREQGFGLISRFAKMHSPSIGVSFTRTKYGSPRNAFMKVNYDVLFNVMIELIGTAENANNITDAEIEDAVTNYAASNPGEIVRIKLQGQPTVYLNGAWASVPDPAPVEPGNQYYLESIGVNGDNYPFKTTAPGIAKSDSAGYRTIALSGSGMRNVTGLEILESASATSGVQCSKDSASAGSTEWTGIVGDPESPTNVSIYGIVVVVGGVRNVYYFS